MDCTRCEELLLERAERQIAADVRGRVEQHLHACPRCREFSRLLEDEAEGSLPVPEDLTAAILTETTASPGAIVPEELLDRELARLASLEVDERFVDDVMAATARADRGRLSRRLSEFRERLVRRPRLTLEGAYAAALIAFLLIGLPSSPLAALPRNALDRLSDQRGTILSVSASARHVSDAGRDAWSRAGRLIGDARLPMHLSDLEQLTDSTTSRFTDWAEGVFGALWDSPLGRGLRWLIRPWIEPNEAPDNDRQEASAADDRTHHA